MQRPVLTVIGLTLGTLLLAGPATAATWVGHDARGDVHGFVHEPDPQPCGRDRDVTSPLAAGADITRLSVRHTEHALKMKLTFGDLSAVGEEQSVFLIKTPQHTYFLDVLREHTGKRATSFIARVPRTTGACGEFAVAGSSCSATVRIRPRLDVVQASLPRTCLGDPAWVRIGASDYLRRYGVDFTDFWGPPGATRDGFTGPYGPRIAPSTADPGSARSTGPSTDSRFADPEIVRHFDLVDR